MLVLSEVGFFAVLGKWSDSRVGTGEQRVEAVSRRTWISTWADHEQVSTPGNEAAQDETSEWIGSSQRDSSITGEFSLDWNIFNCHFSYIFMRK